jgi:WD40 repeat protein
VPENGPGGHPGTPGTALAGEGDPGQATVGVDLAHDRSVTEAGVEGTIPFRQEDSPSAHRPEPTIAGYVIEGELGRGAMGVVYRARQVRLNRPCALKLILAGAHADPIAAVRFLGEAEAVAKLQHSNIVQIHAIGDADGLPFFELEYLPGGSLDRTLDGTPWPARRAAVLIEALARGVAEAHRLQIIHRDLKPSNILIAADGTPKIADFGLAKSLNVPSGLTATDSILGTPSYMAPEQAEGKAKQVGPLADVYALGAILYELLVGRPPFRGATVLETLDQVRSAEPVPPSRLVPGLARDVEVIALKCLQKDPGKRYESAIALAEDLRRFQAGEPIRARAVGSLERTWRWCRRHPAQASAVGAVTIALGAIVAISLLYAERQHHFGIEQAEARKRISKLATDLGTERGHLALSLKESNRRLAIQLLERGQVAFEKGQIGPGLLWTLEGWRSAAEADDPAWRRAARANLSAWAGEHPRLRAVFSHAGPIVGLAISPDGKTVATASEDNTARLWYVATATPLGPPLEHPGILVLAFSPDGKTLATGGAASVLFWDAATGRPLSSLPFPRQVSALAFDPDGTRLLIGGKGGVSRFWDLANSRSSGSLLGPPGDVSSAAFSPDGRIILTGCFDGRVQFWDATTRRPLGPPIPHGARVWAVAFSPDGKTGLTGCLDGRARLWDVATLKPIDPPLVHEDEVRIVAFSPDGKTILSGSVDRTARLWDAVTHTPLGPIYEHQGPIEAGAISPDGEWVLTAGGDSTARVWKLDLGRRAEVVVEQRKAIHAVAFSPDGQTILSGSHDATAQVWDSATGRPVGSPLSHPGEVWAAAISPDGKTVLTGCADRFARLWDAASFQPLGPPFEHGGAVSVVAFSPGGKTFLTGSQDATARLWDAATDKPLGEPLRHPGAVDAGAFSRDGKRLAIGVDHGTVHIWDVETRTPLGSPIPHPGAVSGVAFSPDGRTVVIAGEDGTARLWDLATRTPAGPPMRHRAWIMALAFSPDGKTILTGSWDKTARLWDVATGMSIGPPFAHLDKVWAVAFSPDGEAILTGGDDKRARVFRRIPELPEDLERMSVWIEVHTGLTLDNQGSVQVLDHAAWQSCRQRLDGLGGLPVAGPGR